MQRASSTSNRQQLVQLKLYKPELWRAHIRRQMWTDCAACVCWCCSEQCHNSLYFICSSWMLSSLFSKTIWGRIVVTEFDNSWVNIKWFSYGSGMYSAWTQRHCKGYWNYNFSNLTFLFFFFLKENSTPRIIYWVILNISSSACKWIN